MRLDGFASRNPDCTRLRLPTIVASVAFRLCFGGGQAAGEKRASIQALSTYLSTLLMNLSPTIFSNQASFSQNTFRFCGAQHARRIDIQLSHLCKATCTLHSRTRVARVTSTARESREHNLTRTQRTRRPRCTPSHQPWCAHRACLSQRDRQA